jgi:hypothetical protein
MGIYYGDIHYGVRISRPVNDLRISSSVGDTPAFLRNPATAPQSSPLRGDESKISTSLLASQRESGFSSSLDGGLLEPIYGLIFSSQSDLEKVRDFYKTLTKPNDYRYFVCVDVYTTFNGIQGIKEWQPITEEQMEKFVNGAYEIGFLCDKN